MLMLMFFLLPVLPVSQALLVEYLNCSSLELGMVMSMPIKRSEYRSICANGIISAVLMVQITNYCCKINHLMFCSLPSGLVSGPSVHRSSEP